MATPDYLKFIEEMNRRPLQNRPDPAANVEDIRRKIRKPAAASAPQSAEPILYRRDIPRSGPKPVAPPVAAGRSVALEEAVPGSAIAVPQGGSAYLVAHRLEGAGEYYEWLNEAYRESIERPDSDIRRLLATRHRLSQLAPEDVILLDIETTGLGNSPLFLIGILIWEEGSLTVRQYLARDYSEESAVTSLFADDFTGKRLLVSFNGKSFDLPYIRTRAAANIVSLPRAPAHLDVLHEARRVWRGRGPDCKLQTLERCICGRTRTGDIPGSEIPDAYHAFVRTANAAQLAQIIEHNRLDLITLMELMLRLPMDPFLP